MHRSLSVFPTAKHLASWAGTTPGNNESAGKVKSSRTRPGNPYLQGALGAAAMWAAQNPHTFIGARYRRIASRRGPQRANVAVQHTLLTAIWNMGTTGTLYEDLGGDYYNRLNPNAPALARSDNWRRWDTASRSTTLHDPTNALTRRPTRVG